MSVFPCGSTMQSEEADMNCRIYDRTATDNGIGNYGVDAGDWLEEGRREGRKEMLYSEKERLRLALSSLGCGMESLVRERFASLSDDEDLRDCSVVILEEREEE